jgi:hypothetical protein
MRNDTDTSILSEYMVKFLRKNIINNRIDIISDFLIEMKIV